MTAFDIYSAVGNVGEDILEESETAPKKNIIKIMPVLAAAACFAVLAVGLNRTLRDGGIEEYASETYPAAGSDETASEPETDVIVTESGDVIYYTSVQTAPVSPGETTTYYVPGQTSPEYTDGTETAEMFTEPYPYNDSTAKAPAETEPFDPSTTVAASDAESADEEETAIVPRWEDMSDLERYIYLQYNGNEYSIATDKFDESELTFLQNGELYGFDEMYGYYDEEEYAAKRYSVPCAFYKIKNVNENYMIAVRTADGRYTAFMNHSYRPDTLGSYLEDIDFSNRCKLTTIRSETYTTINNELQTQYFEYHLPGLQQAVEKLLAENSDTVPEINPPPVIDRYLIICGNDTFPTVRISDGGYVGVLGKYFKIGEDKTESFMDYIEENGVEIRYDSNGEPYWDDSLLPE